MIKLWLSRLVRFAINIVAVERNKLASLIRYILLKQVLGANVCKDIFIEHGFDIISPKNVTIKRAVSLGQNNKLLGFGKIVICEYVQTAIGLTIIAGTHNIDNFKSKGNQNVVIGPGCWIGANVTILGNVKIGRGSIIGAGALVNKDIPEFSVAVGVPAKVVKKRVPTQEIVCPFGIYTLEELMRLSDE